MASPHNPNTFTDNPLDRASLLRADPAWLESARRNPQSLFLPLWQLKPLILPPLGERDVLRLGWLRHADLAGFDLSATVFLGLDGERACFAADVSGLAEAGQEDPFGTRGAFEELLHVVARLAPRDASLLAQAKSMVDWHRRHCFCAQCGAKTTLGDAGYRRDCPQCRAQHFPRTDPVVISLVVRDGKCLLGRGARFKGPMFSALAGFLEPGETVEEAVVREVMEEVGVQVTNVIYHFNQPWPYPSSLMIGCIAEAVTEEIVVDEKEIAEARWFSRAELREALEQSKNLDYQKLMAADDDSPTTAFLLPPATAIAHQLLRVWVEEG